MSDFTFTVLIGSIAAVICTGLITETAFKIAVVWRNKDESEASD